MSNSKSAIELLLVFLPAILVFLFAKSWVGENPLGLRLAITILIVLLYAV